MVLHLDLVPFRHSLIIETLVFARLTYASPRISVLHRFDRFFGLLLLQVVVLAQLLTVLILSMFGYSVALLLGVEILLLTVVVLGCRSLSHCLQVLRRHIGASITVGTLKVVKTKKVKGV
jgi:hypothetical protein